MLTTASTSCCPEDNRAVIDIPRRVCYNTGRQRARCTLIHKEKTIMMNLGNRIREFMKTL